jgi:hypothetical protein
MTRGEAKKIYEATELAKLKKSDAVEICGNETSPGSNRFCMKYPGHVGLHRCDLGCNYEWHGGELERMTEERRGHY